MNRLTTEKRCQILFALCEGASVNATARQTGASKVTILKLLADVGGAVIDYQRKVMVNLPCKRVQCDEIWSFVQCKGRRVPRDERGRGRGDAWTWTAICADTKLVPCWHVGPRDADAAAAFMNDLAPRLAHRVQLTTDGLAYYMAAVEDAFGWNGTDYAQLVKVYGPTVGGTVRYSPPALVGIEKKWIMGEPAEADVSTSYIESHNTRMRTNIRRLTRLTNGHSKKMDNHIFSMGLWFMYYNFARPHSTLTKAAKGIKTTPAMAAGLSDHVWAMDEIVSLIP